MIKESAEIINKDGVNYNKITIVEVKEDGTEVVRGVVETPVQTVEPIEPEPTEEEIYQAEVLLMLTEILAKE